MKANRHDYDAIFSVCVLYAAHGVFITKNVYDYKQCACLPIIESKSTIDHIQKLLQALDDGLRWVLKKPFIITYIFKCGSMLIVYFYLYFKMFSCKAWF